MNATRRSFLSSFAFAAGATALPGCRIFTGGAADFDDALTLLVSDVHVAGDPGQPTYHQETLRRTVAEILRLDPLPRRCIVFGDLAYNHGTAADYATSKALLRPLLDAGIELTIGMGNHDNRARFLEAWPEYAKRTRVSNRFVTVASGPHCDFIMTDSLQQGPDPDVMGPVDGEYDAAQKEWLDAELPKWPRPVFVCAHHPFSEIKAPGKGLRELYMDAPNLVGYLYGHNHQWRPGFFRLPGWKKTPMKRQLCLPSAAHWGDIGYVLFRTTPDRAEARLVQSDYFFPRPVPAAERDPIWDDFVAEHQGAHCSFRLTRP